MRCITNKVIQIYMGIFVSSGFPNSSDGRRTVRIRSVCVISMLGLLISGRGLLRCGGRIRGILRGMLSLFKVRHVIRVDLRLYRSKMVKKERNGGLISIKD